MKKIILDVLQDSLTTKEQFIKDNLDLIQQAADSFAACITSGHKIMIFGNGGSAADAQHIAAEFVNRFQVERMPLAALALTTDTSVITSIANDYHFDQIFSKQIQALGKKDDIAMGLSTSGGSKNVIQAMHAAKDIGMLTIGIMGRGGELAQCTDLAFRVNSGITARIQEAHITLGHILCDLAERILYPEEF